MVIKRYLNEYVREDTAMGTIGSATLIDNFKYDSVLVLNSDILTNLDYVDFYSFFIQSNAVMAVAATNL
jgi:NDP-sugar pyrophosphorylase family protein